MLLCAALVPDRTSLRPARLANRDGRLRHRRSCRAGQRFYSCECLCSRQSPPNSATARAGSHGSTAYPRASRSLSGASVSCW
jgi:hypothetical protein